MTCRFARKNKIQSSRFKIKKQEKENKRKHTSFSNNYTELQVFNINDERIRQNGGKKRRGNNIHKYELQEKY